MKRWKDGRFIINLANNSTVIRDEKYAFARQFMDSWDDFHGEKLSYLVTDILAAPRIFKLYIFILNNF